jgi:outer membrane protein assembly factor BamA
VRGARSRLEVMPLFGDLTFSEVTADYRRYFAPVMPFTFAFRGLHIGRYGPDADSGRINPLFLGYPTLVRGYDVGSFSGGECVATTSSECPAFDRLVGSRLLVGNVEVRFPLVGAFRGEFDYGAVPIDGVVFADTGLAWTAADGPSFADGSRDFVSSVGVGLRFNAFGYLIAEIDAVRPLDRPDDRWQFLFALKPGF